jgi:hypothetical protein
MSVASHGLIVDCPATELGLGAFLPQPAQLAQCALAEQVSIDQRIGLWRQPGLQHAEPHGCDRLGSSTRLRPNPGVHLGTLVGQQMRPGGESQAALAHVDRPGEQRVEL